MAGYMRCDRPASEVKASTIAALQSGKGRLLTPTYATVDYSGWCEAAIVMDQAGYGHFRIGPKGVPVWESMRTLSMLVRCRKCGGCQKERRHMWAARAASEWTNSTRTWFVTLTLRPSDHYKLQAEVAVACRNEGYELDSLKPADRLNRLLEGYKREMDLYLKRLRKGRVDKGWKPIQFRVLWVPEPHKSGAIHFHMLLHEISPEMALPKARVEFAWGHGFVKSKLVKSRKMVKYVTKYLGKHHFDGRLRASQKYGRIELDPAEKLRRAAFPGHDQGAPRSPYQADEEQAEMEEWRQMLGTIPGDEQDDQARPVEDQVFASSHGNGAAEDHQPDDDPYSTERGDVLNRHGVPKRKWPLRGWHEPTGPAGRPKLGEIRRAR